MHFSVCMLYLLEQTTTHTNTHTLIEGRKTTTIQGATQLPHPSETLPQLWPVTKVPSLCPPQPTPSLPEPEPLVCLPRRGGGEGGFPHLLTFHCEVFLSLKWPSRPATLGLPAGPSLAGSAGFCLPSALAMTPILWQSSWHWKKAGISNPLSCTLASSSESTSDPLTRDPRQV